MANRLRLANIAVNAKADALARELDGGYLLIYGGTQPPTADAPAGKQAVLAELRFSNPCAGPARDGVLRFNPLQADERARASGQAAWFRCVRGDGETAIMDGSVGREGCDLNLNITDIALGAVVSIREFTYVASKRRTE